MKREEISDALDLLDDDMLGHTDHVRSSRHVSGGIKWKRWSAVAACVCICCVGAFATYLASLRERKTDLKGDVAVKGEVDCWGNDIGMAATAPASSLPTQKKREEGEEFVAVSSLLGDATYVEEMAAEYTDVSVGQYSGRYVKVSSARDDMLSENTGSEVEEEEGWYRVSGHSDLQYLIRKEKKKYSLWKFRCFHHSEYPYRDVLEQVYGINSASAIVSIQVNPAEMDNTDEGKKIQKKIGTHKITDRDSIETIYQVLSSMICYGEDHWDRIDYGDSEMSSTAAGESHRAVRLGRYLSLVTDYGNAVDGLKYTAVSDMFYEFSGIAYNRLDKKQAKAVRSILGIK